MKIMTMIGMVAAVLLGVVFTLDLAIGIPFGKASMWMDICMLVCSLILGFLSWTVHREQAGR